MKLWEQGHLPAGAPIAAGAAAVRTMSVSLHVDGKCVLILLEPCCLCLLLMLIVCDGERRIEVQRGKRYTYTSTEIRRHVKLR